MAKKKGKAQGLAAPRGFSGGASASKPAAPSNAPFASRASAAFSGFYGRIPVFPFLDRDTSAILYACMLAFLLFVVYVMAAPAGGEPSFTISESPLYKNANLSLSAGENYSYVMEDEGQLQMLPYSVGRLWGCKGVVLYDGNDSQECLTQGGNPAGGAQYNSTLGNSTGIMFLPWMLAVSDNFSWSVSGDDWNGYIHMRTSMNYTSLGKSSALGREAYRVRVTSDMYPEPTDYYIDSEKRILLYVTSGNTSAWLEEAPFAIDVSQIPEN